MRARRSASRTAQRGAIEEPNRLAEAFPLIAAGVLVLVGVVLFMTVLWPESETTDRGRSVASATDRAPAARKTESPRVAAAPAEARPPAGAPAPQPSTPAPSSET